MTRILVINTGGTISMSEDKSTGKVKPNEKNPIGNAKLMKDKWEVHYDELMNIPSPHIAEREMLGIKNRIDKAVTEGFNGVVVTHGTDTLEETAYYLDLTATTKIPVVITGAMRSSNEIGADGLVNLRSSLIVAASEDSLNRGVLVVMNDEVHRARFVTKTHTTNVATFQSPTFGAIGLVSKERVDYFQNSNFTEKYQITENRNKVYLVKAYAGMDGSIFDSIYNLGADGLVIEALGAGNMPPGTIESIDRFLESEIPVVFTSRAFNGMTQDVYNYKGGGGEFKEKGVIFTRGMSGLKARIKLKILLDSGVKREDIGKCFLI